MPATKNTPQTTRFRKLVLAKGKYPIGKNSQGESIYEEFSEDRLKTIAATGNAFMNTGAKIPVPFAHVDDGGKLVSPINIGSKGVLMDALSGEPIGWRADLNAGFTTKFDYGEITDPETGETETGLLCEMEIDGTPDQVGTPAAKFGRTIREVSIGILRDQEDKLGNKYDELPIHVAACINPRNSVQTNFVPVETLMSKNVLLFNVSTPSSEAPSKPPTDSQNTETPDSQEKPNNPAIPSDPQASEGPDVAVRNVVEGLRSCGIDLPEDTNLANFFERATIAIRQKLASDATARSEGDPDSLTKQPEGKVPTGAPIAMSTTTNTPAPTTPDAGATPDKGAILFSNFLTTTRTSLAKRIEALVKKGRISSKYATETLGPKVEAITLSNVTMDQLNEKGELDQIEVETLVSALESIDAEDLTQPTNGGRPPGGLELEAPEDSDKGYLQFHDDPDGTDQVSDKELLELSASIPVI